MGHSKKTRTTRTALSGSPTPSAPKNAIGVDRKPCAGAADGIIRVDGNGYVCRFNEGDTYDGARIDAYWKTPMTDLDSKAISKHLEELYLRGSGGILSVEAVMESGTVYNERLMPGESERILELGLTGDGRAFQLIFRNVNGSHFTIDGGVELILDTQRRVL